MYITKLNFNKTNLPTAELMLLLTAIFWGTSYGLTKEALIYVSVIAFLAIRFSLTFILLLPLYLHDYRKGLAKDWVFALPTGLILFCIFLAETYGVMHTTASNAAFLISLCVLITPFIEWAVFKSYPSDKIFALTGCSLIGVFLLTNDMQSGLTLKQGDMFILLAAFLRACMVVGTKFLLKDKKLSSICLTTIQSATVAMGALVLFIIGSDNQVISLPTSTHFWTTVFYLVVFCTIFAFFAQNYGVRNTSPSKASLLMGTEPAFGAIFAITWLGESFTLIQTFGGILIVLASIIGSLPQKQH